MSSLTIEGPKCQQCRDTGWRFTDDADRRVTRCSCWEDQKTTRLNTVLPPLYHDAKLDDVALQLRNAAEQYLEKPSTGLLLVGPTGSGKTFFAAAILRAIIEFGRTAIFKTAADFYMEVRDTYRHAGATEGPITDRLANTDFLLLDDLGAGSFSDHERRSTLVLLDRRMNNQRPTIVTTNLTLEQIGQYMDERIASRLSGFTRIAVTGRDRRARRPCVTQEQICQ